MSETYTQKDSRLKPLPLSTFPWKEIPSPSKPDAIVKVYAIPTNSLSAPAHIFTPVAGKDERVVIPSWSFLIEKDDEAILWDLGLREDPERSPEKIVESLSKFVPQGGKGAIHHLQDNKYDLSKIKLVILSHKHFDHYGNLETLPTPSPPIILGPGTLESIGKGYPEDKNSPWPSSWLRNYKFLQLPEPEKEKTFTLGNEKTQRKWEAMGCFDDAIDWFGDGSFWIINAPGHLEGHVMALARVTADPPTYILLAGDASHSQDILFPVPNEKGIDLRVPLPVIDGKPSLAINPEMATYTCGQITRMSAEENIMCIMAHEGEIRGVVDLYPDGDLGGWKEKGWKEAKEKDVDARARARGSFYD